MNLRLCGPTDVIELGHMVSPKLSRGWPKEGDVIYKIQCLHESKEINRSEATPNMV